jgi:hypothetical protein
MGNIKSQLLLHDGAEFERVFHTTHFFVTNFFVISRCKDSIFSYLAKQFLGVSPLSGSPNAGGLLPSFCVSGVATIPWMATRSSQFLYGVMKSLTRGDL